MYSDILRLYVRLYDVDVRCWCVRDMLMCDASRSAHVHNTVEVRETESRDGAFSCNAVRVCESDVYSDIQG